MLTNQRILPAKCNNVAKATMGEMGSLSARAQSPRDFMKRNGIPFACRTTLQCRFGLGRYVSRCSAAYAVSAATSPVAGTGQADAAAGVNYFGRRRKASG